MRTSRQRPTVTSRTPHRAVRRRLLALATSLLLVGGLGVAPAASQEGPSLAYQRADDTIAPLEGATVPADVTVRVDDADPDAIYRVRYYLDGDYASGDRVDPYPADLSELADGEHTLTARVVAPDLSTRTLRADFRVGDPAPADPSPGDPPPGDPPPGDPPPRDPPQDRRPTVGLVEPTMDHSYAASDGVRAVLTARRASSVGVSVQDRNTKRYLRADGTFRQGRGARLPASKVRNQPNRWAVDLPDLPAGEYGITSIATNNRGNDRQGEVRFAVGSGQGDALLTLQMGRTMYSAYADGGCSEPLESPIPNSGVVDLAEVGDRLAGRDRPIAMTGVVIGSFINNEPGEVRHCGGSRRDYANWDDLASLRDDHGWSFTSGGEVYVNMVVNDFPRFPGDPIQSVEDNICGSLDMFTSRGHDRAHGMYSYPNNDLTNAIQRDVTSTCFAFGRTYRDGHTVRGTQTRPGSADNPLWFQRTESVTGGRCRTPNETCDAQDFRSGVKTYPSRQKLVNMIDTEQGLWSTIQFYTLVEGAKLGGDGLRWDCRGDGPAAWDRHWTSRNESFCFNDLEYLLDQIDDDTVVTDPLGVAEAWGRDVSAS